MEFVRELTPGMEGEDVRYIKERLFELGYYTPNITAIRNSAFGNDTAAAVKKFQDKNFDAYGTIGPMTWNAIENAEPLPAPSAEDMPAHIGAVAQAAISSELGGVSAVRRSIVLDALAFAFDVAVPAQYPLSFYIRGGNLYNTDLTPNVMTAAKLKTYFGKSSYAQYFDGGRKEMMQAASEAAGYSITGADCSGGVVGLLRHAGVVNAGFDLSADGFNAATNNYPHVERAALRPADILHRTGHVGFYVGGGYAVEWVGGAYGCQLTKVDDRRVYNFLTGKSSRFSAWQHFLSPRYY